MNLTPLFASNQDLPGMMLALIIVVFFSLVAARAGRRK